MIYKSSLLIQDHLKTRINRVLFFISKLWHQKEIETGENYKLLKILLPDNSKNTFVDNMLSQLPILAIITGVEVLTKYTPLLPRFFGTLSVACIFFGIIYSAIRNGLRLGLASACIASIYSIFAYLRVAGFPRQLNSISLINSLILSTIFIVTALLVGRLRDNIVNLIKLERKARAEAEQAQQKVTELNKDLEKKVIERTEELMREIEERTRAEQAVKKYSLELERSNKELADFAYIASHDLKEPLRKIQTFGDRLKTDFAEQLPLQGKEYITRMHYASARMQSLITDLLSLSRVSTQSNSFKETNLNKVLHQVISDLEISIEKNRGKVEIKELPTLEGDPIQIHQLFQNIISNALKFHRKNTPPVIKIYTEDESLRQAHIIIIEDNGIGFDEKYADKIFEVFQRLHGKDEYEGTGIGLAICRKIVERHHGRISCKSIINKGTKFIIEFPATQN